MAKSQKDRDFMNYSSFTSDLEIKELGQKIERTLYKKGYRRDSADMSQEIMLGALRNYNALRGASFATFCWSIMRNKIVDTIRDNKKRFTLSIDASLLDHEDGNNKELAAKAGNTSEVLRLHLKDFFDAGIITSREHDVLSLKGLGYNYYEISEKMDIALGSAHGIYERAMAKMAS